jgi:hypothetical protein
MASTRLTLIAFRHQLYRDLAGGGAASWGTGRPQRIFLTPLTRLPKLQVQCGIRYAEITLFAAYGLRLRVG